MKSCQCLIPTFVLLISINTHAVEALPDTPAVMIDVIAALVFQRCDTNHPGKPWCTGPEANENMIDWVNRELAWDRYAQHINEQKSFEAELISVSRTLFGDHFAAPSSGVVLTSSYRTQSREIHSLQNVYSSEFILASVLRGFNELNFSDSKPGSIQISDASIAYLKGFRDEEGRLIFEGLINRANAAGELRSLGFSYHFLRSRTQWLFQGKLVHWKAGDGDLLEVYLDLLEEFNRAPGLI